MSDQPDSWWGTALLFEAMRRVREDPFVVRLSPSHQQLITEDIAPLAMKHLLDVLMERGK